ncbi:MAG: RebB family R body protein [Proteobacteria bacterium]|nr:RebB family R body protein [Pseudomonadota bacterium]
MASDTPVNSQITDAVTQSNLTVLGGAPAQSLATVYQVMAQTVGASMQNAVSNQQSMNTIDNAIVSQGIAMLYSIDSSVDAKVSNEILSGNVNAEIVSTLQAIVTDLKNAQAKASKGSNPQEAQTTN